MFRADSGGNGPGVLRWRQPDAGTRSRVVSFLSRHRPAKDRAGQGGVAGGNWEAGVGRIDGGRTGAREKEIGRAATDSETEQRFVWIHGGFLCCFRSRGGT